MSANNSIKRLKVNLIPKSNFESTDTGKVVGWLLGTFRLIVIFVEIIVVSGFAARFYLDLRHGNLNDQIKRKISVLEDYQGFERDFKRVQKKQELYTNATSPQTQFSPIIAKIVNNLPPEIKLISISKEGNNIKLSGAAIQEQDILQFLVNLQQEPELKDLTITSIISPENSPYIEFTLENLILEPIDQPTSDQPTT